MATTLALGDVVRLRVACYTTSQVGVNVCHFRVSSVTGASQTDVQVAAGFDLTLNTRYKDVLSVGARYRGVSCQRIRPLPVTFPAIVTANDGPGLVAGDMMPTQTAGVITCYTDLAGAANRGRVYIPFPGETDNAATGIPVAGYVTNLGDIGDELYTPIVIGGAPNAITLTPVVYHRAAATFTDITSYVARGKWGTQRRRGAYGKTNPTPF